MRPPATASATTLDQYSGSAGPDTEASVSGRPSMEGRSNIASPSPSSSPTPPGAPASAAAAAIPSASQQASKSAPAEEAPAAARASQRASLDAAALAGSVAGSVSAGSGAGRPRPSSGGIRPPNLAAALMRVDTSTLAPPAAGAAPSSAFEDTNTNPSRNGSDQEVQLQRAEAVTGATLLQLLRWCVLGFPGAGAQSEAAYRTFHNTQGLSNDLMVLASDAITLGITLGWLSESGLHMLLVRYRYCGTVKASQAPFSPVRWSLLHVHYYYVLAPARHL